MASSTLNGVSAESAVLGYSVDVELQKILLTVKTVLSWEGDAGAVILSTSETTIELPAENYPNFLDMTVFDSTLQEQLWQQQ
jgi:hypothetical protein